MSTANTAGTPLTITHHPDIGRFEAIVDGLRCEVDYVQDGRVTRITHTGVPRPLEGRGIAAALVSHALDWVRQQGQQVDPVCSYVAVYIRRNPEWQDLLA